jgi:hypothetical protein
LLASFESPIGFVDTQNNPLRLALAAIPSVTFECRTARTVAALGAFEPCDGSAGTTPEHFPKAVSGTNVTEIRARSGTSVGPVVRKTYYVHPALDGAEPCPQVATDAAYYTEARRVLDVSNTFTQNELGSAFVKIVFPQITYRAGRPSPVPAPFAVQIRSLHHRFAQSDDGKLVLVTRRFASPTAGSCVNRVNLGKFYNGPYPQSQVCDALAVNAAGVGACIKGTAGAFQTRLVKGVRDRLDFVGANGLATHYVSKNGNGGGKPMGGLEAAGAAEEADADNRGLIFLPD